MSRARSVLRRLPDERAQALVLALLVLTVLAIALSSVIYYTSSNQRASAYQKARQVARSLAEAGVNNGISVLSNAPRDKLIGTNLLPADQAHAYTNTYPGGSVQWWATFNSAEQSANCPPPPDASGNTVACVGVWTLYGTSTVANPTGPTAAAIHRTMTAKMQVYRLQTSLPLDVWNWIFSPYNSHTANCDTSFTNSLTINVPVWIGGNLCMNNSVQMTKSVYVGGYANVGNPQAKIGTSASPVAEAYVGNGCWFNQGTVYNPCVKDGTMVAGKAAVTKIWATTLYTQSNPIPANETLFNHVAAPPLCWAQGDCPGYVNAPSGGWYSVASPGPLHSCDVASTSPAGNALPVFDNNTAFDNSVPTVFNLTPALYSYTCRTSGGELSWNNTTKTLTVQGVIFIDGSVTASISGNQPVTYVGWGDNGQCTSVGSCQSVLFLSGTFFMSSESLCAVSTANGCDAANWDPNKKLLIVATHGSGGQVPAGDGVNLTTNKAAFQGGLYAVNSIDLSSGASSQGPLVSGTGTIMDGQSGTLSFPVLTISPFAINAPPSFLLCDSSQPCRPYDFRG